MSDDLKPKVPPPPPPPPAYAPAQTAKPASAPATPLPVGAKPATGQTPGLQQQTTVSTPAAPAPVRSVGPVIEYTMPVPKRPLSIPQNLGCLVKMIFGFTVLLLLGYFALLALNPKARSWATQGAKDGSGGPTPFKVINQILAIPARAIGKTAAVVKADHAPVGQLDGPARATAAAQPTEVAPPSTSSATKLALAEKPAAKKPAPVPAAPRPAIVTAPAPDSPDQMKLAGDILIAHASPAGSPRATAAFFYWVVKLNIGGVTQGKPSRVLINNRLIYEGDEVNRTLGVVFVQLDPANKLLVFRDQTGATVTRSY